jgi:hypothetical protein
VFSVGSVPRSYKKARSEDWTEYKVYRTVVESSELVAAIVERQELDGAKKTSSVI